MSDPNRALPKLPCMCASFRRASRAITQLYDDALRLLRLRATQFTVLQALSLAGEVTQGELGRILALDSTTLTRTLRILDRRGWVAKRSGKDRREWRLRLSTPGVAQFRRALPLWKRAQSQLRDALGGIEWDQLMNLTNAVTNSVTK